MAATVTELAGEEGCVVTELAGEEGAAANELTVEEGSAVTELAGALACRHHERSSGGCTGQRTRHRAVEEARATWRWSIGSSPTDSPAEKVWPHGGARGQTTHDLHSQGRRRGGQKR